jgi:hypothetical protein
MRYFGLFVYLKATEESPHAGSRSHVDSREKHTYQHSLSLERSATESGGSNSFTPLSVEANYKGKGKWFSGMITAAWDDGACYDILYDDGDVERRVPASFIRVPLAAARTLNTHNNSKQRIRRYWNDGDTASHAATSSRVGSINSDRGEQRHQDHQQNHMSHQNPLSVSNNDALGTHAYGGRIQVLGTPYGDGRGFRSYEVDGTRVLLAVPAATSATEMPRRPEANRPSRSGVRPHSAHTSSGNSSLGRHAPRHYRPQSGSNHGSEHNATVDEPQTPFSTDENSYEQQQEQRAGNQHDMKAAPHTRPRVRSANERLHNRHIEVKKKHGTALEMSNYAKQTKMDGLHSSDGDKTGRDLSSSTGHFSSVRNGVDEISNLSHAPKADHKANGAGGEFSDHLSREESATKPTVLPEGTRVRANFLNNGKFYPGVVTGNVCGNNLESSWATINMNILNYYLHRSSIRQ